ncbi:MAG TPA: gliding motility-associated protein GldE [Phnomibacter sp.]|nr:gliding motility-associated protein GldE [Phnomibacter sp.]
MELSVQHFKGILLLIHPEWGTALGIVLALLMAISAAASGAEVAFFSLNFKDINFIKTRQQPAYKRILTLLEKPKLLLGSLLIANCIANIGIIIIAGFLLDEYLPVENEWAKLGLKIVIIAFVLLLFAEILPKTLAAQSNIRFAKDTAWLVEFLHLLLQGWSRGLTSFSDSIEKRLGQKTAASSIEELNQAIDNNTDNNATEDERNILKGILKFGNITVKQVMKARLDVHGISFKANFEQVKRTIEELHYSRLPVYNGSLDDIKGMIHTKDLLPHLSQPDDYNWQQLMRPAYFVHEQKMIEDLMQEFQQKRIHFAIVVDEFGGTSGIVTHEDILEEIIGDIKDEFDDEETTNKKIDDLNYLFEGKTMLNDVCKQMDLASDTFDAVRGESDSLAGLVLEVAGEIPKPNQVVSVGDFDFTVLEVNKNRIQKIKVTIKPATP